MNAEQDRLTSTRPWCLLIGSVQPCARTAHTTQDRRLFAAGPRHSCVRAEVNARFVRSLVGVPSGPVTFEAVPATPVGAAAGH